MLVTNTYTTEGHCQRVNWAFPEVLGLIFRRLKDHSEFERIFGEAPSGAHSTIYPTLKLSEITKFMSEMKEALPKSAHTVSFSTFLFFETNYVTCIVLF